MARVLGCVVALVALLFPQIARAQQAQQVFDFFLNQANQELQRQQQREIEKAQRRQQQQLQQQFVSDWRACFEGQLELCDQALSYSYLVPHDRQRLLAQRAELIRVQEAAAERAQQERITAEIAAQKARDDAAEQRRSREREQEDTAVRQRLLTIEQELIRQKEADAAAERKRSQAFEQQRAEADKQKSRAEAAEREHAATVAQLNLLRFQFTAEQERKKDEAWTSTTLLAALLALLLSCGLLVTFRDRLRTASALAGERLKVFKMPALHLSSYWSGAGNKPGTSTSPQMAAAPNTSLAEGPVEAVAPKPAPEIRDTPAAMAALELAQSYIEEVREADTPGFEDEDVRKAHLNTLSLAAKQLDAASRLDPDAVLEGENQEGVPYRFTINELKAQALFIEGVTHHAYDTRRAVPALQMAIALDPRHAPALYALGLTQAANMNKAEAVMAFERAVALDPQNLTYRKELDRAQNMTGGQILSYKATRAGERIYDAGLATANAGIRIYNVLVVCWNIFAVVWNVLTFPIRLVLKMFGLFDRILGIK